MDNNLARSCAANLIVPPVTSQPRQLHSMMTEETSQRTAIHTLAPAHHAPRHARTPYARVTVYNEVLPVVLCQKLAVEIKGVAGADPDAHKPSIMHPVPSSVYQTIWSILGGDPQVVPLQVPMEARLVPARVSSQGVPLHQVRSSCWLASLHPLTTNHDMLLHFSYSSFGRLTPPRLSLPSLPLSLAVAGPLGSFWTLGCTRGRRLLWRQARRASRGRFCSPLS